MAWFDLGDVRWLGVIVATLAAFLVQYLWFRGRAHGRWLAVSAAVTAVTVVTMNVLMAALLVTSVTGGLASGVFLGLVWRVLGLVGHEARERRPLTRTLTDGAADVVALAVAGAVLGAFL